MGHSWIQDDTGRWKSRQLSTYAGGYTAKFASELLCLTAKQVNADHEHGVCPVDVFARQRRVHEMAEALPFARGP